MHDTCGVSDSIRPPAPRPCDSCPYRRDVPSGIWADEEYEKLRRYDRETPYQPAAIFSCHQNDKGSPASRICAGWAGCHDASSLLALRVAVAGGRLTVAAYEATIGYESPLPLFTSGNEAADHGRADLEAPGRRAVRFMDKIARTRRDIERT
ncbi:DUF6283 family protein [Kitasatospora cheerisanensis]|uniref:DUF6283 family protein n=1 Tax=Kitasatospora cheerisanensis TaxID=81942 RepID=UPI0009FD589F